jgi:hypothetical protein
MRCTDWPPLMVEAYLVEAADTLHRLPEVHARGYISTWPNVALEAWQTHTSADGAIRRSSPRADAITRLDTVLLWLRWLEPRDRQIVWARACGTPWKVIAYRHSMDRTTAWRHRTSALRIIARRVCACADTMPVQHFSMQHSDANLVGYNHRLE